MKHPEILLLPVLMFADYFLTVFAAVLREKRYGDHIKTEHYELNPVFQKAIRQKQWINPRHILLTLLSTGFFVFLMEVIGLPDNLHQGFLGYLFVMYGTIIGRHLSNIVTFWQMTRRREEITGQTSMTHSMQLSISMYQYLVVVVPIGLIALFSPTPFVMGGLVGLLMLFLLHLKWIGQQTKPQEVKPQEASTPPPADNTPQK